jgi:GNAT superfamily N-acetyltransferase
MSTAVPAVRTAEQADAVAIAHLLDQLGYPSSAEQVAARLPCLMESGVIDVIVACIGEDVVGVATFHLIPVLHEDAPRGQLTALVVAESARRRGIGALLVRQVEERAAALGVLRLVVTTANRRTETHTFYERLGFEWTGRRYARLLRAG